MNDSERSEDRAFHSMILAGMIIFGSYVAFMVWVVYSVIESIKGK